MKFNIKNPAFLQMASHIGGGIDGDIVISYVNQDPSIKLSCTGEVKITCHYQGTKTVTTVTNVTDETIDLSTPAGSIITLDGNVTEFSSTSKPYPSSSSAVSYIKTDGATSLQKIDVSFAGLSELDLTKNTNLTSIVAPSNKINSLSLSENNFVQSIDVTDCLFSSFDGSIAPQLNSIKLAGCPLVSLDLQNNELLTSLNAVRISSVNTIYCAASNEEIATTLVGLINNSTSVDGTVTLRQGDEHNQTVIDAAMEKGWDVQYFQ